MPKETKVFVCDFCGIYMNENETLVALHERNLHSADLRRKHIRAAVDMIVASGRPPEDPVVWAEITRAYPRHIVDAAVAIWSRAMVRPRYYSKRRTDSK